MLTWLSQFSSIFGPLNLFRYITFRTGGATATALFFVFFFGPSIIAALRLKQGKGQPIRDDGPPSHLLTKTGTPTMGGLMILSGLIVSTLLWANLRNHFVWIVLLVMAGFGAIGFYDDLLKVTKQTHKGFSGRRRLALEVAIAVTACFAMMKLGTPHTTGSAAAGDQWFCRRPRRFLSRLRVFRDRFRRQRGQSHGWPRRPRHRARDDRRGGLRNYRLSRR